MNESILSRFLKGTIFTGTGRLFIVIIGLFGFMLTARWLTSEELGMFTLLQVSVGFIISFSDFGLATSITKFLSSREDPEARDQLIYTSIYSRLITLAAASGISLLARQILFDILGGSIYLDLLVYIPILVCLDGSIALLLAISEGLFKFRIVGTADALGSIVNFIGILILVISMGMGLSGRIYARILSSLVTVLFILLITRFRPKLVFSWIRLKEMITFGFPLYINQVLTFVFLRADTVIIGTFLGASEIGIYEIARKIPESIEMLYDAFRKVYFPFISKLFMEGKLLQCARMLNTSTRLISFLGNFGVLGSVLFGSEIIRLLFSERYLSTAPVFAILMAALVLRILDYTLGYTLVAIGDSNKPPLINTVHTVVNFIGYFILVPIFRVAGAAAAGIIGTAVVNPLNMYLIRRRQINASYSAFLLPFFIFLLSLLAFVLFSNQTLLSRIAILLLYLALSMIFSVVKQSELTSALSEIRKLVTSTLKHRTIQ